MLLVSLSALIKPLTTKPTFRYHRPHAAPVLTSRETKDKPIIYIDNICANRPQLTKHRYTTNAIIEYKTKQGLPQSNYNPTEISLSSISIYVPNNS